MRRPPSRQLVLLGQITRTREMTALALLARAAGECRVLETAIAELRRPAAARDSLAEAAHLSRWMDWRQSEIDRLTSRLALKRAEQVRLARLCGRALAENSVMERLVEDSRKAEFLDTQRRASAMQTAGAGDGQRASHLLADDVGDQDVGDV